MHSWLFELKFIAVVQLKIELHVKLCGCLEVASVVIIGF